MALDCGERPSSTHGVTINLSRRGRRVVKCLLFARFACRTTNQASIVAIDFGYVIVGVGFLLAALAEQPEDDAEHGEREGNTHCAADDDAEMRV